MFPLLTVLLSVATVENLLRKPVPCSVCSTAYFSLLEAFIVCQKEGKVWIKNTVAHHKGSSEAGLGQGCPVTLTGMLYSPIGWK